MHLVTLIAEPKVCPGGAEVAQVAFIGLGHCDLIYPAFTVITPRMGLAYLDPISDVTSNITESIPRWVCNLPIVGVRMLKPYRHGSAPYIGVPKINGGVFSLFAIPRQEVAGR
jgi:hypothetical protein